MSLTYTILLFSIMSLYITAVILMRRRYNKNIKIFKETLKSADATIYELTKYNELLSKLVVKYQSETGTVFRVGMQSNTEEEPKLENNEFDLDEILSEIAKNGVKNITKEKLDFLNKYKKK